MSNQMAMLAFDGRTDDSGHGRRLDLAGGEALDVSRKARRPAAAWSGLKTCAQQGFLASNPSSFRCAGVAGNGYT
jgi:hypothetical protein